MSKHEAKILMGNSNLIDKKGVLQFFLLYIKMNNTIYYQRNREIIASKK